MKTLIYLKVAVLSHFYGLKLNHVFIVGYISDEDDPVESDSRILELLSTTHGPLDYLRRAKLISYQRHNLSTPRFML
jgi:hypothetical protein